MTNAKIRRFKDFDDIPEAYHRILQQAERESLFLCRDWFENLAKKSLRPGQGLCLYGLEDGSPAGEPIALFVGCEDARPDRLWQPRVLASLTNFYTMEYGLLSAPDLADPGQVAADMMLRLGREGRSWDMIVLGALDRESPNFERIGAGLRQAGFSVSPLFQFGNWYERIDGRSFEDYKKQLPTGIRQLDNKYRKSNKFRFALTTGGDDLENAIVDYQKVYSESWKEPEQYPDFMPGFIRLAAARSALRLGLLYVDGVPAAAQIWIKSAGRATIYKIAYDPTFKKLGVGSMLSLQVMRHVIDVDGIDEVDYGSGDDPYKAKWMSSRRERWTIVAYNTRTLRGAACGLKSFAGRAFRRVFGRLLADRADT